MEKVKRLQPKKDVLRELYLKSGNECAFPNCTKKMISGDGKFLGQICHIEAAEERGQRFNKNQTNEERRDFSNLMLMCYEHHVETNDVVKYDVAEMRKLKKQHENKFTDVVSTIQSSFLNDVEKGAPLLLRRGMDSGTQKWTRQHSLALRQATPALTTFKFECMSGSSLRTKIKSHNNIFSEVTPNSFKKGDFVELVSDASKFDAYFLGNKELPPLLLECISESGKIFEIKLQFDEYDVEQVLQ